MKKKIIEVISKIEICHCEAFFAEVNLFNFRRKRLSRRGAQRATPRDDTSGVFLKWVLIIALTAQVITAQVENLTPSATFDAPEFFFDALSFSSNDSTQSRVDLYIQVPYDALQFIKAGKGFIARYEITMNFIGGDKSSVSEKLWTEEVKSADYSITESRKSSSVTQRSVQLAPGVYTLRAQLRDLESKKVTTVMKKLVISNYSSSTLTISDLMLVNRVSTDGDRRNIMPNISGNIGENNNSFYVFFEVYNVSPNDSLQINYTIVDSKGSLITERKQFYRPKSAKTQLIAKFDSTTYSTGNYIVTVEVQSLVNTNAIPAMKKQKNFIVRWGNMPVTISDIDLAIRQMRYIAKEKEFSELEKAKTQEQKQKLFEEFWKRHDPSPDTRRNEFMDQYYQRVEYANKNFSHYQQGWKTDMGMVFILFGSPNNVERHPFDIDAKPYEIWSYYDYNRQVIFIDDTGFGDYKLLTPIWDMLQRLKY